MTSEFAEHDAHIVDRGRIIAQYWLTCGLCDIDGEEVIGDTHARRAAHARQLGWVYTKKYGWLCPTCTTNNPQKTCSNTCLGCPDAKWCLS
jgi:hypothetical protein